MNGRKIQGLVSLIRPEFCTGAGLFVVVGEVIAVGGVPPVREAMLGFVAIFFIFASINVLNDYFDLEVDHVNAPHRPLPSGVVSPLEVVGFGAVVSVIGLVAGAIVGVVTLLIAVVFWAVGFLYNWRFKAMGLSGNLMVSSSVAGTFIFGGVAVGEPFNRVVWSFAAMVFVFDLGEEIAGDAMDALGDVKRRSRSVALVWGRNEALHCSGLLFLTFILLSLLPYLAGWLGPPYLVVIVPTDVVIAYSGAKLVKSQNLDEGRRRIRHLYLGLIPALVAFVVGVLSV